MYLYLAFMLVQSYSLISKLLQTSMPFSAVVFSIVVFFIWTFIPFSGYCLAKLCKANGNLNNITLFFIGIIIGAIDKGLFHFKVLTQEQNIIGTLIIFSLFFATAYIFHKNFPESEKGDLLK